MKIWYLCAFILFVSVFEARSQWLLPGRQARVATNEWTYLRPDVATVQSTFDFLDARGEADKNNLAAFSNSVFSVLNGRLSWTTWNWINLPHNGTNLSTVFNWIDQNWNANRFPGTNLVVVSGSASLVGNQWFIGPFLSGTNIAGATFTNNQWSLPDLLPGTNIQNTAYNPTSLTWEARSYGMVPMFDAYTRVSQVVTARTAGIVYVTRTNYTTLVPHKWNSGFNQTSGVFTAPSRGYYSFSGSTAFGRLASTARTAFMIIGPVSGGHSWAGYPLTNALPEEASGAFPTAFSITPPRTTGDYAVAGNAAMWRYMNQGDQVAVLLGALGGTGNVGEVVTNTYAHFQGFYLYGSGD